MPKPSVYRQLRALAVGKYRLFDSPRHWNCGLFRYKDRLWMSYRYHMKDGTSRCQTAICPIDPIHRQPEGPSQWLEIPGTKPSDHHEDARLFLFKGEPYISLTEMTGYRPGVDFKCVMKYGKLTYKKGVWSVGRMWQPAFGSNDGGSKEKNWVFFEADGRLYCVYAGSPKHVVLELNEDRVVARYETPGPYWPWGVVRGGTPPILLPEGEFLTIFHSSLPTEKPPAYVRYYGGAYKFQAKPPFLVTGISPRPILSASEEDGHQVDPRYVAGWKPFVVFPAGLVPDGEEFLMSFGVNDWQCAIANLSLKEMPLVAPDGSAQKIRCFRRENGSLAVEVMSGDMRVNYLYWEVPAPGPACTPGVGYMRVSNVRNAEEVSETEGVTEISEDDYQRAMRQRAVGSMAFR